MATVELYDLTPSPNNIKVRVALGYKGIPHVVHPVGLDDMERKEIVELSGQPLTPIIRHGETVICDSASILRYLDTNFRDTPPILFTDRATMQEAEKMERWARGPLTEPVGMVFGEAFSESPDVEVCARASALMNELTGEIEGRLAESDWLVGGRMSIADITAAPSVLQGMLPEEAEAMHPAVGFFRRNLRLGDGRERTRAWVGRVMAHDRGTAGLA